MALSIHDDHGIRFEYPAGWEAEVSEDGSRTTVTVQSDAGPAFALVTVDDAQPEPSEMVDEALAALREEYPELDAEPASERIDGREAIGHDVEFLSLDAANSGVLRAYRTGRRTVFVLAQWSDLEGDEAADALRALRRSIEETDA